jgi:hypothetical protein
MVLNNNITKTIQDSDIKLYVNNEQNIVIESEKEFELIETILLKENFGFITKNDISNSYTSDRIWDLRIEDKVYFVEGGVPGDLVDILVEKDKKSFAEARVYRLKEASPEREPAFCSHFGICGGCKWQNLNYQKQLE